MKNKNTVIDFLNLAELATQCFFVALDSLVQETNQNAANNQYDFKKYLLSNYTDSKVAVCVICHADQIDQIKQKLSLEKVIQDSSAPNLVALVIDRIIVTNTKMDRLDLAVEYAKSHGFEASFYILLKAQSGEDSWHKIDIPKSTEENLNEEKKIIDSLVELSWDAVYERFSRPARFYQFQSYVMQLFGFKLSDKTTLIDFLSKCKKFYLEKPDQIQKMYEFCSEFEEVSKLVVDSDIYKLPRKSLNALIALKAFMLSNYDETFTIDGPLPQSILKKIKYSLDSGKVRNINSSSSRLNWDSLPKAQDDNLSWAITIPDSAHCCGSLGQYFGIVDELTKFYSQINKNDYRGKTLQQVLDGCVIDFIQLFGNHPKFRGFSGVWNKMNLPNYNLSQRLEELSYPDTLLVTVAKSVSRIRENSVVIPAINFEGINSEQAKKHLVPVIEWCEHHRCYVYL